MNKLILFINNFILGKLLLCEGIDFGFIFKHQVILPGAQGGTGGW